MCFRPAGNNWDWLVRLMSCSDSVLQNIRMTERESNLFLLFPEGVKGLGAVQRSSAC